MIILYIDLILTRFKADNKEVHFIQHTMDTMEPKLSSERKRGSSKDPCGTCVKLASFRNEKGALISTD